ncbi:MAG TPA: glycosyltransferase family 1 protein [Burkholderiaceae bacterium]
MTPESTLDVLVDARWPAGTGIGRMAGLYRTAAPVGMVLRDLDIRCRIGSPRSPWAVDRALAQRPPSVARAVFWNPGFVPPASRRVPSVVTVHDLTHRHHYTVAHRLYYDTVLRPLYRRCDLVVCISRHTRDEFLEWSGMPEARVAIVPNAIAPDFAAHSAPLPEHKPFLFYAGNRRAFKNVPTMVRAFVASRLPQEGFELALTGAPDEALLAIARASGVESSLRFLGFLTDAEVAAHYRAATCVPYLSRYEGFGLPILESWATDAPVLLANASCLPEVGGDAALYVEPDDIEQIAQGMRDLCLDGTLRQTLIERGRERLRLFDPSVSAAKLWRAVADVAAT